MYNISKAVGSEDLQEGVLLTLAKNCEASISVSHWATMNPSDLDIL